MKFPQRSIISNTSQRRTAKSIVDCMFIDKFGATKESENKLQKRRRQMYEGKLGRTAFITALDTLAAYHTAHPDLTAQQVLEQYIATGFAVESIAETVAINQ